MENLPHETASPSAPPRRWPFFLLGFLLFALGLAIYAVQIGVMKHLKMPWYLPILGTVGVLFMALSFWQRPGVLRGIGVMLFALLCVAEWFMPGAKTPDYTGPAQPGRKLPAFTSTLADGTVFASQDLEKGGPTLLVFFRGHW